MASDLAEHKEISARTAASGHSRSATTDYRPQERKNEAESHTDAAQQCRPIK